LQLARASILQNQTSLSKSKSAFSRVPECTEFFIWTLTHPAKAFSEIQPKFQSREELESNIFATTNTKHFEEIISLAELKISKEWRAWVNVHSDMAIDEDRLDNMLMMAIYRLIINRDSKRCIRCNAKFDLTIHHIIPKQRNYFNKSPPFGRSVPTNLVTLCKACHSSHDPFFSP
jgi:hypothetical protein